MKFSRQTLIKNINRFWPPSSTSIHQPGEISEHVQLVADGFPPSWSFEGLGIDQVTAAVGAINVLQSLVPTGRYRWVMAAHLLTVVGPGVAGNYGMSVLQPASGLGVSVVDPFGKGGTTTSTNTYYQAGFVGVVSVLDRPIIVGPGFQLQGFRTTADVTQQLRLEVLFREYDIGDPYSSV